MSTTEELNELRLRKARLRARIAVTRQTCVEQAGEALRPLAWIDRTMAQWRRVAPLAKVAAVPLSWLLWRRLRPRGAAEPTPVWRWLPTLIGLVRAIGAVRGR